MPQIPKSKLWSAKDLQLRLDVLTTYGLMTKSEVSAKAGRTMIYLNQMVRGKATISSKTQLSLQAVLRERAVWFRRRAPSRTELEEKVHDAVADFLEELAG